MSSKHQREKCRDPAKHFQINYLIVAAKSHTYSMWRLCWRCCFSEITRDWAGSQVCQPGVQDWSIWDFPTNWILSGKLSASVTVRPREPRKADYFSSNVLRRTSSWIMSWNMFGFLTWCKIVVQTLVLICPVLVAVRCSSIYPFGPFLLHRLFLKTNLRSRNIWNIATNQSEAIISKSPTLG